MKHLRQFITCRNCSVEFNFVFNSGLKNPFAEIGHLERRTLMGTCRTCKWWATYELTHGVSYSER